MTPEQWRDEIVGALRQHFLPDVGQWRQYLESVIPEMIRTVTKVERESCARIAKNLQDSRGNELLMGVSEDHMEAGEVIANAIRARGTP